MPCEPELSYTIYSSHSSPDDGVVVSDKELTINSEFLEKQEYGDQLTTIKIFLVINYCKTAKCKKLVI